MFNIAKRLGIATHQIPRVRFMWILRFLFQVGFVFAWTIVTAVFIDLFTISKVLYLLLIDAGIFLLGSFVANYFFIQKEHDSFLISTILGTIACVSIAALFRHNTIVFLGLALLAKDFFFAQLGIGILRKNESLFSPSEAQRIMPILESSLTIGTIMASALFLLLLTIFKVETLFVFWIIPLGIMFFMVFSAKKILREIPTLSKHTEVAKSSVFEHFVDAQNIPFLKYMTLVVFLQAALFSMVEFEFLKSIDTNIKHSAMESIDLTQMQTSVISDSLQKVEAVGHEIVSEVKSVSSEIFVYDTMAHSLGVFSLFFGLVALMVQLFLTHQFIRRIGIVNTMLVYISGLLGTIALFLFGGIGMGSVKTFQHGAHSLFEAPYHITFYSIFSHSREHIRYFFEGIVKPLGVILGVTMLISLQYFSKSVEVGAMGVVALFIISFAFMMKSKFTKLSKENLRSNQNISAKLHAVEVLAQKGHEKSAEALGEELLQSTTDDIVKEKIIHTISKINDPHSVHVYLEILTNQSTNQETKIQILDSLLKFTNLKNYWESHVFSQHHLLRVLQDIFDHTTHTHLKKLVVMNIFKHLPPHKVADYFLQTLKTSDCELQAICLRSASEIFNDPEMVYYVRDYLSQGTPKLKGYAIIALWKFDDQQWLSRIIAQLLRGNREERIAAIYAIGEIKGDKWRNDLRNLLNTKDLGVKVQVLVALMKLKEVSIIDQVMEILLGQDTQLSRKMFFMLKRVPKEIRDIIKNEISFQVSGRVLEILVSESITHRQHLQKLSGEIKRYLRHLYRLGEKYDDLVLIGR